MIQDILNKEELSYKDLLILMNINNSQDMNLLLKKAYEVKLKYIGNNIYFRGLIECSNICIKNCNYCGIRKNNKDAKRFAMSKEEIVSLSKWVYDNNFGSLAIQAGERNDKEFISLIRDSLLEIQDYSNNSLGITLSLGEQSFEAYKIWKEAGASRYLLRIETTNKELFYKIHPNDELHSFDKRLEALDNLKKLDYQVGTGVMIGLPNQTNEDLVRDIMFFKEKDIDMIGMGPYIPHEDTPLGKAIPNLLSAEERINLSLKMIAITRIYLKDVNIAATTALHTLHPTGREKGILAGANIIMPNATTTNNKVKYELYKGKPGLNDDADKSLLNLYNNLKNIGENVVFSKRGDSPHYFNRMKNKNNKQN